MRHFPLMFMVCALSLAACKDPPPSPELLEPKPEPAALPETATPTALPTTASPTSAPLAILPILGNAVKFQFSLKESPDALKLQTLKCAAGDGARQAACLADVEKAAATEGIRFEQEEGRLLWVSFGVDKEGKEEIYLRGQIALMDAPADELHFRPIGAFTGTQAADAHFDQFPADKFMTLKAIDARTVVMLAPQPKGALMYHRQ
jgi:hypothetical protein